MDAAAPADERRILLFGQTNLNNSVLIGFIHQNAKVDCQLIDLRYWRTDWEAGEGEVVALVDVESAAPERIQELLDRLHDRPFPTTIALFNVPRYHPSERLISWPKVNGLFYAGVPDQQMVKGIDRMFTGELWLPRHLMAALIERSRQRPRRVASFSGLLTKREEQILRLTATGATNTEVAEALNVSMHTVKTHVYNLFKKIGVTNRIQAVNWAKEHMEGIELKDSVSAE
ncbi:MAG: LuxR C-terminal-related transcriptional regulator [Thalassolituus sp.]